jgi:SAM-dependent methyltransferase
MTSANEAYTGADNLEVMREAVNYNAWLLRLIRRHAPPQGRVLDFGAGSGTFALPLHRAGLTMTCVEPDAALGSMLRSQGLAAAASLDALEPNQFDFAYTLNVLEHIDDDRGALSGLYTRLKPGGRLLVYVPAFQVLYGPMDRKVGHLRRYRRRDLARRIREAGFNIEKSRYADSLGFFAALAFRMLKGDSTGELNPAHIRLYDRCAFPLSLGLDMACWPFFGKNVLVVASRPAAR